MITKPSFLQKVNTSTLFVKPRKDGSVEGIYHGCSLACGHTEARRAVLKVNRGHAFPLLPEHFKPAPTTLKCRRCEYDAKQEAAAKSRPLPGGRTLEEVKDANFIKRMQTFDPSMGD